MANAISTLHSHVSRALDFYNKTDVYFCIGKTSAWSNDSAPPTPDSSTTDVAEIIGYKKVSVKQLVIPDNSGAIVYRSTKWTSVSPSNALTQGAKWVYIECSIQYDELPLGYYRQIGVYTGLVKQSGVASGKFNLVPSEVADNGILEVIDYRTPAYRAIDSQDTLRLIIQF